MKHIFFTLSLLFFSGLLTSQTVYTNADGDFQWLNPNNWDNGLPTSGNDATINAGDSVAIVLIMDTNMNFHIENNGTICLLEGNWEIALGGEVINNGTLRFKNNGTGVVNFDMFTNNGEVYSDEELGNHNYIHNNGYFFHNGLIANVISPGFVPEVLNADCAIFIAADGSDMTDGTYTNEGLVYILGNASLSITTQNGIVLNDLSQAPAPTAVCITQPLGIQLVGMNTATVLPGMIDDGSNISYCNTGPGLNLSPNQFNCSHIGDNIVTLTVEDGLGNAATCTAIVNVVDGTPPTANCPSNMIIDLAPGACEAIVNFDLQEMDNCGMPVVTQMDGSGLGSGDAFPIGLTSLFFQISDSNPNNNINCAFTVQVNEFDPNDDTIACDSDVQVSLGANCEACISAGQILMGDYGCYDDFLVEVNNTGTNCVDASFLESTVVVTITDPVSGNSCAGTAIIEDKLAPEINCPNVDIPCAAPFDVGSIAAVTFTDNCDPNATLTLQNEIFFNSVCVNPDFNSVIIRTWRAEDVYGNTADCQQTIRIERGELVDVVFPVSSTVDCTSGFTPDITGYPTIDGFDLVGGMPECNLAAAFEDEFSVDNCSANDFTIFRTWTVVDHCGGVTSTIQIIHVEDSTAPTLTCPDDITISTDANLCTASFQLPDPMAVDNCSGVTVTAEVGNLGIVTDFTSTFMDVPVGTYVVTYLAEDACGNISNCTFNLTVVDDIFPTAICELESTVNLPNTGFACVDAEIFDEGSFDNCGGPLDFQVSLDMVNFTDCVEFDCDDAGNVIMVAVQISEVGNPSSASICMIEVSVFDKIAPFLTCPMDLTIDCNNPIGDLSVFGEPTIFDGCPFTVETDSLFDISQCGEGFIERYFTVTDESGNEANCTQTITIDNMNPFDGSGIIFPSDTTIENQCPEIATLSVDMMGQPVLPNVPCALLAVNFSDQLFNIEFPACYKLVRTWTVLDWCQYDADDPNTPGVWTSQQIIKVIDTEGPVITSCPDDITVSLDANCQFGEAVLADVTATDCSTDITITNDSGFATLGGANASGFYTEGIHTVLYRVKDGCGNTTFCDVVITVEDLKMPTPYCTSGVNAELQQMTGGIMAMVDATLFDFGSFDNCTAQEDLIFNIGTLADTSAVPTTTMLTFDCSHIGNNDIILWVTDESGNSDYCITNLEIQDNMDLCDDALMAGISGDVMTEMGNTVEEVTVVVSSGSNALPDITLSSGSWAVPSLPLGQDYEVIPEKDIDVKNGISTYDLVLLTRHILDVEKLDSPYKIIAGDVNNSGEITTIDKVWMRKVILQMEDEFPNNDSWRFVDMDYNFVDPENPLNEDFPEIITVEGLPPEGVETDFYGIKVGDLNNSANANSLMGADDRNFLGKLSFIVENRQIKEGEVVEVNFNAKDFKSILGFQFTFQFDKASLEFIEYTDGNLVSLTEDNFGFHNIEEGMITGSWYDLRQPKINDQDNLFSFKFRALADGELRDMIGLNSAMTASEAYNADEDLLDVRIEFNQTFDTAKGFELLQNRPNPFTDETEVDFYLPEASEVNLTVYELSGKTLKTYTETFGKGWQKLKISSQDIAATGVLYYKLETETEVATRKMILLP